MKLRSIVESLLRVEMSGYIRHPAEAWGSRDASDAMADNRHPYCQGSLGIAGAKALQWRRCPYAAPVLRFVIKCCIISLVAVRGDQRGAMHRGKGTAFHLACVSFSAWWLSCVAFAQPSPEQQNLAQEVPRQLFSREQLDTLVAPTALCSDSLLRD